MSFQEHKITEYAASIAALPDKIENRAEWLKKQFDARTDSEVKDKHNGLCDALDGMELDSAVKSTGSLTTQPAASNNEQNDNTAAQIRAAAAARARYEAIKDEQAEERLTGIAQGTEMAPKNSQNPLLNWSPKSFPGLTIQ